MFEFTISEAAARAGVSCGKVESWFENKYLIAEDPDRLGFEDIGRIRLFDDLCKAGLTEELAGLVASDILCDGDNISIHKGTDRVEFSLGKFATLSINASLLRDEVRS